VRGRSDAADAAYFALFVVSAWFACSCIWWRDWLDLALVAVPFVGWTLERDGFRVS
jgi:hypothetical protein